ncbi:MAG: hypothetical protein ABI960_02415 [Candidatus Eisenbacteria bacterium]
MADPGDALQSIAEQYATCTRCADLGVAPDPRRATFWRLSNAARPEPVRVLFIAESPPQLNRRGRWSYFYLPQEKPPGEDASTLFWALAEVLALPEARGWTYATAFRARGQAKPELIEEMRARGLWLVDAAKCAVNGVADAAARKAAVGRCAEHWLWRELRALEPEHIVLVKTTVRDLLEPMLTRWGFGPRLLGSERIPHPGSGQRANFRAAMRRLIARHPGLFGPEGVR